MIRKPRCHSDTIRHSLGKSSGACPGNGHGASAARDRGARPSASSLSGRRPIAAAVLLQVLCGRPRGLAELEAVSRQVSRDMWHIVNLRIASVRKRTRSSNRSNRTKRLRLAAQPDLRKCGYRHQQRLQPVSSIAKAISASNERRIMIEKATRAKEPNTVTEPRRD